MPEVSHIATTNLGKEYRTGTWGLMGASIAIEGGVVCALVGPNGAGKSTLINLLGGALRPTEGTLRVQSANGLLGWCPQRDLVDWSLTVVENISLAARLAGIRASALSSRVEEAIQLLGLSDVTTHHAENISGGQVRRMQIARAIVARPDVLILDEPASGLDPHGTEVMLEYLRRVADDGALLLVSSHDLLSLEQTADMLIFMQDGHVAYSGDLESFVASVKLPVNFEIAVEGRPSHELVAALKDLASKVAVEPGKISGQAATRLDATSVLKVVVSTMTVVDYRLEEPDLRSAYLARVSSTETARGNVE